tara:strand:- start:782 stop:1828 length:1047 start_codon:yes stop_codon:yes gene_type:complete
MNKFNTADFDYILPKNFIAQEPVEPRDHSKLMILNRHSKEIDHSYFYNLPDFLKEGDLLVLNNTRVIPAKLTAKVKGKNSKIEILLLEELNSNCWKVLAKPGKKLKLGTKLSVYKESEKYEINAKVESIQEDGSRIIFFDQPNLLTKIGNMPLPPYINNKLENEERYQTVYSKINGSIAAPTAGLHFTPKLLSNLKKMGVDIVYITLHVGWGTFNLVKETNTSNHLMHEEYWNLTKDSSAKINEAIKNNQRIIAVGTTCVRLLEHVAAICKTSPKFIQPGSGKTDLFILPGYEFLITNSLITNFHLPKSTLLMLTEAFAGKTLLNEAYEQAKTNNYRFYSLGDSMLII